MKITQLLRFLPIRLANIIFARLILKTDLKNKPHFFKGVTLRNLNHVKLDLNPLDIGHQYLAFTGIYESSLTQLISKLLKKNSGLMVDVGANYGYYSILWTSGNLNNKCIAFEASPKNTLAITNNIMINNLEERITLESLAVSNLLGEITFDLGPEEQTGWGGISHEMNNKNHVTINSTTLDLYFNHLLNGHIEVLKIDTEGADYLVLKGAEQLLSQKKIKHIFWEENNYRAKLLGLVPYASISFLEKLDYKITQTGDNEYHATFDE